MPPHNKSIATLSKAEQALANAKTPEQSQAVEAMALAAKAWAKEQKDFDGVVETSIIHILARRKTTELIEPPERGGDRGKNQYAQWQPDIDVRLPKYTDYGITEKQWSRRRKELEDIDLEDIKNYKDECIEKHIEPTVAGLLRYALQIVGDPTGNEWWTPAIYIESVRNVLGTIDLDPASCPEANEIVQAKKIYTEMDSGLLHSWNGRVFMNPPYSENKDFAEKMCSEYASKNVSEAIVLLGAHAIETKWFAEYWNHVLCFTGHRIKFNTPSGPAVAGNIAGSVFVHLGKDSHKFAEEFNQHGYVVRRWPK